MIHHTDYPADAPEPAAAPRPLTVRFFGVGDAGCKALEHLARLGFTNAEFIAVNTDAHALHTCTIGHKLPLGARTTHGLGTGGDMQIGHTAAQEGLDRMRHWCKGADLVFFLTSLGGGTGSGATPVLARLARECEALVIVMATLPFEFESHARHRTAGNALDQLKAAADAVVTLPLAKLLKLTGENPAVPQSLALTYDLLGQSVAGIWRLLHGDHLLKLDFANLRAVFRGRHAESAFATVEATGPNRAREIMEKLTAHPLLEHGQILAEATSVLVSFAAAGDLGMNEIGRVMEDLNRHCVHAQPAFGAVLDPALGERLLVTVFAARHSSAKHLTHAPAHSVPAPTPAPVPAPVPAPAPEMEIILEPVQESLLPTHTAPASRIPATLDEPAPAAPPPPSRTRAAGSGVVRPKPARPQQQQLPLEAMTKGRFEKCEPTMYKGEDLDIPTVHRRRTVLN